MKVLHVISSLSLKNGGPPMALKELVESLIQIQNIEIDVCAVYVNISDEKVDLNPQIKSLFYPSSYRSKFWVSFSSRLKVEMPKIIKNYDLIHIHEIWHYPQYFISKLALKNNIPYLLTIHGALANWCIKHKYLKKLLFLSLIQKSIFNQAAGIHALTIREHKDISKYSINKNIFVINNGFNVKPYLTIKYKKSLFASFPEIKNKRIILFLGRLHPVKGIDLLLSAFARLSKNIKNLHLMIVGPDTENYKKILTEKINNQKLQSKITFTGPLYGNYKIAAYEISELFTLPSYSEGFSMSILEAMSRKKPVVITESCHFDDIEKYGCGKIVKSSVKSLNLGLNKILEDKALSKKIGQNGYNLLMSKYQWKSVSSKMRSTYKSLIKNGDKK